MYGVVPWNFLIKPECIFMYMYNNRTCTKSRKAVS